MPHAEKTINSHAKPPISGTLLTNCTNFGNIGDVGVLTCGENCQVLFYTFGIAGGPGSGINSSQQPLFQDFTDISGTMDNAKDKNIRFGNLVNDLELTLDDLPVFKVRDSRKLRGNVTALRMT